MKYFFRRSIPAVHDVLVIESGSPQVARRAWEGMSRIFPGARYHLLTCLPDPPSVRVDTVFRASDYPSWRSKLGLLLSFRRKGWEVMAILCTGERILWRWKMLALFLMPAKVLVVNENAHLFWLDWEDRRPLLQLWAVRCAAKLRRLFRAVRRALVFLFTPLFLLLTAVLGALVFLFTLLYLLLNAMFLYARRWCRLATWRITGKTL